MKTRISLFAIVAAAFAFGCSKSENTADAKVTTKAETIADPFLAQVPAESVYFASAKGKLPAAVRKQAVEALSTEEMSKELEELTKSSDAQARWVAAFTKSLKGHLQANTFSAIGIGETIRAAVYGLGVYPVVALELTDNKKFESWLSQLETESKLVATTEKAGNKSYRIISLDPQMNGVVYIGEKVAKFALVPTEIKSEMIAYVVGDKKPAKSINDAKRVQSWRTKHKATEELFAYFELDGAFKILTQRSAGLNMALQTTDQKTSMKPSDLDDICTGEIDGILSKMPRFIATGTYAKGDEWSSRVILEMQSALAKDLMTLTPKTSAANHLGAILAFGISVDSGALIDLTKKTADAIAKTPFKCAQFQELNQNIAQASAQFMFIPPFARAFKGIQLNVNKLEMNGEMPNPTANLIIYIENAPAVFAAIKGMVPMLASLPAISPDGKAVALAGLPIPPAIQSPQIAMGPNAIGFSIGAEGGPLLTKAVLDAGAKTAPVVGIKYNFSSLLPLLEQQAKQAPEFGALMPQLKGSLSTAGDIKAAFTQSGLEVLSTAKPIK